MAEEDGEEELLDKFLLILDYFILVSKLNKIVKLLHFTVKLISDDVGGFLLKWGYLNNILVHLNDNWVWLI